MRARVGIAAAAVSSALLTACSALVAEPPDEIFCVLTPEGEDPCPEGLECIDALCQTPRTCTPLPAELCNGVDDDCDTWVDEGLEVDVDGDSYLACNSRAPTLVDCDDAAPLVFPHEPGRDSRGDAANQYEPCNGRDDDCNASTTETDGCGMGEVCYRPPAESAVSCFPIADCRTTGGSICGMGTFCGPEGRCLPEMMGMECTPLTRDSRCQTGSYCNAEGTCVDTLTIGAACTSSVECASSLCFPNTAFGLPGPGGFCGQSCCTNGDCGLGFSCFTPGTGARSCLPSDRVTEAPVCSRDSDCGGDRCRAVGVDGGSRSQCSDPGIRLGNGSFCPNDNSWCASGICWNYECSGVCQTNEDCGGGGCTYTNRSPTVPHCVSVDLGPGGTGDTCAMGCRDNLCWNDVCADACCTDDQCSVGRCIPVDNRGWEMRCVSVSVVEGGPS